MYSTLLPYYCNLLFIHCQCGTLLPYYCILPLNTILVYSTLLPFTVTSPLYTVSVVPYYLTIITSPLYTVNEFVYLITLSLYRQCGTLLPYYILPSPSIQYKCITLLCTLLL